MDWRKMAPLAIVALAAGPAMAQTPFSLSSTVETGWTSNATDSAIGGADFYTSQNHELSLTGKSDNLVLRGSLSLSQTRFMVTQFENDDALAGGVEAQLALGNDAVLRLGYAATHRWTGDDLSIGGLVFPVRIVETEHEYLAELLVSGAQQQLRATLTADWVLSGNSEVGIEGLAPLRMAPDVGSVTGRVAWERALSPRLAALAGMAAWFTLVPDIDRIDFLRLPAVGGRIDVGLRLQEGNAALEARGGVDMVWPKGLGAVLTRTAPYLALAGSITPLPNVRLALASETGVELADPLDGVAGRTGSVEFGAEWEPVETLKLSAQLAAWREWALFDDLTRSRRSVTIGAHYALSDHISYGAALSFARYENPGESYDKVGIALSLTGAL